jgi:hypothetical protein
MSEGEASGSDDFSSLGSFFFYSFIVHPCTAWILKPGRFDRKKSIMYAIAFLAGLAAIKTGEFIFYRFLLGGLKYKFSINKSVLSTGSN